MKRIAIKVVLEQEIWISEEVWENFGEKLPSDVEDVEMLQHEALTTVTELVKAEKFYPLK